MATPGPSSRFSRLPSSCNRPPAAATAVRPPSSLSPGISTPNPLFLHSHQSELDQPCRQHRRGHRSAAASERRRTRFLRQCHVHACEPPYHGRAPAPPGACGQPRAPPKEEPAGVTPRILSSAHSFSVWFINARSINGYERRGEIQYYLDLYSPDIFGIVETWLDEHSVKHLSFSGYALVHRRDRPGAAAGHVNHGGVVLFRRCHGAAPLITFLEESTVAERIWARVETDLGPFLLGLWYRPPGADLSLEPELTRLSEGMLGVFLCGDFNIWQRSWLRYSPCDTPQGSQMQACAHKFDLKQFVKDPTHIHGNLLDMVLSSLPFHVDCSLTPRVADHNGILSVVSVPVCTEVSHSRTVWDFKHADWDKLKSKLRDTDWNFIHGEPVDSAASKINDIISRYCAECIPNRALVEKRKSHPWINDACATALRDKAEHEQSEHRDFYAKHCGEVIEAEFARYVEKTKRRLSELPQCSKLWWRVSSELLDHVAPRSGLPSLRASDGRWLHEPTEKANLFAEAFSNKFVLPPDIADIEVNEPPCVMDEFVPIRCRTTRKMTRRAVVSRVIRVQRRYTARSDPSNR